MIGITLKEFQTKCVNQLLDSTSIGNKKEVLVQAPTGSGKTIILIDYIEQFLETDKNTIFVWLTPGKGELEEQSKKKMDKYAPQLNSKNLSDVILQGFEAGDTAFINWEAITKKDNRVLREAERKNLFERIDEAYNRGYKFIIVIDEEHLNKTYKADEIIQYINAEYIIRVSATTKTNKEAEYIEIKELDVIAEGLITKALYINESMESNMTLEDEHEYLLGLALEKRNLIKEEYKNRNIRINPLIIIQMPNNSDDYIKKIEKILNEKGISYKNKALAKWLSGSGNHINTEDIENNEAEPSILIMKLATSTGWDCPRAKILVKLRDNMSEDFEIQTLGRIRRMPQAKHYECELLDNCYLYTFDEKFKESIRRELGNGAKEEKNLFLKKEFKDFSLIKEYKNNQQGFGDRETFNAIHGYFIKKYNLTKDKKKNTLILESAGYNFNTTIDRKVVQDKITQISSDELKNAEKINIVASVNTHKNGIDLRHSIGVINAKIGVNYDITRVILERLFLKRYLFQRKFLNLALKDFYAFIINNEDVLKHDCYEAIAQPYEQAQLKLNEIREEKFKFPISNMVKYDPLMRDVEIMEKSVYVDYPSSSLKSRSERVFEFYCENSVDVKWYYKNGESSQEYFSIVYLDNTNKQHLFYPDYIVCDSKDKIWILETKGGEDSYGNSKNIDMKAENKFEALKRYATKHNLNWGFIRDYDKNNRLYFCNTIYTDEMDNDNWVVLDNIF